MPKKSGRATAGGAAAGKARRRPGFSYVVPARDAPPPKMEKCRRRFIPLQSSSSPQDEVLFFCFRVAGNELLRFTPTPIHVKYQVKYPNKDYEEGSNDAGKKHPYRYCQSSTAAPRAYLDSLNLTSAFFSNIELDLDNNNLGLQTKSPGYMLGFYSRAQKIFMSPEDRMRYFNIERDSCVLDENDKLDVTSPPLSKALKSMDFQKPWDPEPRSAQLGWDSVPLLGYPYNFQLQRIRGQPVASTFSYLPAGTEVVVRLHR